MHSLKVNFVFLNKGKVTILGEDPAAGDRYIIEDREQNMMHSYRLFELQGHRSTAKMDSTCRILNRPTWTVTRVIFKVGGETEALHM